MLGLKRYHTTMMAAQELRPLPPVVLPPAVYNALEAKGDDMRPFVRSQPIPVETK